MSGSTSRLYNNTIARRILFTGTKASSVLVDTVGIEFILSAGAFHSPQMLMVSGIGPPEVLAQYQIPLIAGLPGVGQNLWDHPLFSISYRVATATYLAMQSADGLAAASAKYLCNRTGPLTNPGGDLVSFEKLPSSQQDALSPKTRAALAQSPPDWPEIEYLVQDGYAGPYTTMFNTAFMYASPTVVLVAPLSRGNVTIASHRTIDLPVVNPNWLTHRADQELAVAAFRRLRRMMDMPEVGRVTISEEVHPGRKVVSTDEEILQYIRDTGITAFHAAGTCKMGQTLQKDPMAVVDSRARVFGTTGLRVVDASAMPFLVPGHPQGTICEWSVQGARHSCIFN
ncbi:hypothetical protein BDV06DRAFT_116369 [Aspergillus oleicola]